MPTATRRLRSVTPRLRWYAFAVGLSTLALVLMLLLRPLMESSIFFLFVAAVAISAMYGRMTSSSASQVRATYLASHPAINSVQHLQPEIL